ncbi:hypothetical protein HGRIS_013224 [Hohenbuehelia grisea]|uniref:SRR1-like domain-containing protein n=1 Tax=Hohenbuehelia grisea TaxID=104357 RepID=A0ABR3IUZ2_9AGAR
MSAGESSFRYAEFTVSSRKRRKNVNKASQPSPITLLDRARMEIEQDSAWFARCMHILQEALTCHRFTSPAIICLGLGSPTGSRDALMQLAFLLRVCDTLDISTNQVSLYDPVFTDEDKALFEHHKLRLITENNHGAYPADVPTIFLMPHCDLELYESLCRANWCRDRLANLLLVANSFAEYVIK